MKTNWPAWNTVHYNTFGLWIAQKKAIFPGYIYLERARRPIKSCALILDGFNRNKIRVPPRRRHWLGTKLVCSICLVFLTSVRRRGADLTSSRWDDVGRLMTSARRASTTVSRSLREFRTSLAMASFDFGLGALGTWCWKRRKKSKKLRHLRPYNDTQGDILINTVRVRRHYLLRPEIRTGEKRWP